MEALPILSAAEAEEEGSEEREQAEEMAMERVGWDALFETLVVVVWLPHKTWKRI